MNDKEMIKIIKEIAECNKDSCNDCKSICDYYSAITLFCEKVLPEGSVVLSKEEYEVLKIKEEEKHWLQTCMSIWKKAKIDGSKEIAKEILKAVLEDVGEFYAGDIVEELAKQYGVEVEE